MTMAVEISLEVDTLRSGSLISVFLWYLHALIHRLRVAV